MPVCNSCGNVITGAWKFCRYCGSPAQDILSSGEIVSGLIRQSNDIFIPSEEMQETALVFRMPLEEMLTSMVAQLQSRTDRRL